ncbi:MAG: SDR family NAD(P)-dependent oxidoreductase [Actinomycetia bacterium]|nr:SDR family NAD(P)-dependent oxidoreductase [Actinomycetes bacterium]
MHPLALVTGASAGIGREIAADLARRGYDIVGVGASTRIADLGATLPGVTTYPVQADLGTADGVAQVWSRVEQLGRGLDVAVLNAGRSLGGAFLDTDLDDELALLSLNVTGQVRLAKPVVRLMAQQGRGHILITSSLSATTPTPYESIYGPTRAFMLSFAEGLREELREYGVVVTCLLPGATATEFHHRAGMDNTVYGDSSWKTDPALVARLGVEGLFADQDHVIGGGPDTHEAARRNLSRSWADNARAFAETSRPPGLPSLSEAATSESCS